MRIVDSPSRPPGFCAITRTSVGPFIDTDTDFDDLPGYGRLYVATSTVSDMAQMLGFSPPEVVARVTDEASTAGARVAELEAQLAKLQPVKDLLDAWNPPSSHPGMDAGQVHLSDEQLAEIQAQIDAARELDDEPVLDDPGPADPTDTPDGEALQNTLDSFRLQTGPLSEFELGELTAFYDAPIESIDDLVELDPPPDDWAGIQEWVDAYEQPIIARIRREIAVAKEIATRSEKDRRKGVLGLTGGPDA